MALDGEHAGIVEVKGRQRIQYQSSAAEEGAKILPQKEEEPQLAVVSVPQEKVIVTTVNWDELVPVTARATILRTQIGPHWYSIQAGKKYMVPRSVKLHLEEKGIV
jgi:hypothetical protein